MPNLVRSTLGRAVLGVALLLAGAAPARAAVQVTMNVEGPRGPFATRDLGTPNAMKVTNVQLDLAPLPAAVTAAPRPVVVTRPIDELSWQFLDAVAANDVLRVVITISQSSPDSGLPLRRVVILSNAHILSIHDGMDATGAAKPSIGVETIALGYERLEVEDDGAKVFSTGG